MQASTDTTNNTTQLLHTNNHDQSHSFDNKRKKYRKGTTAASRNTPQNRNEGTLLPPPVVETVISSSQSQTFSIGIGEFGMNPAHRGNVAAFSMAVNDNLFVVLYSSSYRRRDGTTSSRVATFSLILTGSPTRLPSCWITSTTMAFGPLHHSPSMDTGQA